MLVIILSLLGIFFHLAQVEKENNDILKQSKTAQPKKKKSTFLTQQKAEDKSTAGSISFSRMAAMDDLSSSLEDLRDEAREQVTKENLPEIQPLTEEQKKWKERNVSTSILQCGL